MAAVKLSRAAALAWTIRTGRGETVTPEEHNAVVATLAVARDALAAGTAGRVPVLGRGAAPSTLGAGEAPAIWRNPEHAALWQASSELLRQMANASVAPATRAGALLTDGVVVDVVGRAASALVPPGPSALIEAPEVQRDGPALVNALVAAATAARHRPRTESRSQVPTPFTAPEPTARWLAHGERNRRRRESLVVAGGALAFTVSCLIARFVDGEKDD